MRNLYESVSNYWYLEARYWPLFRFTSRIYWDIMHRFHPKHQYNKIKIRSLSPGYYDPDVRMLHACFDLFSEWYEYNFIENQFMEDTRTSALFAELYHFWNVDRPSQLKVAHNLWLDTDDATAEGAQEIEDKIRKEETENLIKLLAVRDHIWYA